MKKLGKKEDESLISSDAQLDAKLEVFLLELCCFTYDIIYIYILNIINIYFYQIFLH